MMNPWTEQRHKFLIEANIGLLRQGMELLRKTSDDAYTQCPADVPGQRLSSHFRHVLEFYECLLSGIESGHVDYDARRRDHELEKSRRACLTRIQAVIAALAGGSAPLKDSGLFVRVEDAAGCGLNGDYVVSSIGRELQALSSHTVHHFGLIAMIARLLGIEVDEDFGFAPSTLRYRASQRTEAA